MLLTVVHLMFEAVEWLRKWRSSVRCLQLIYKHLDHSSVILRQTPDRTSSCNELTSCSAHHRLAASTAHVLWTNGRQQLAVLPSQVALLLLFPMMIVMMILCH